MGFVSLARWRASSWRSPRSLWATSLLYYLGPNRPAAAAECLSRARFWRQSCGGLRLLCSAWYVRNIANYNVLYGSVGAVIALLVWMYLLSIIALFGCEFNAQLDRSDSCAERLREKIDIWGFNWLWTIARAAIRNRPSAVNAGAYGKAISIRYLLGVTGSGKTFTMAKVIEASGRPSLVLAHNKLLAAQLYHEFKTFFPHNAVEYFVSYYDYYQPEAYIPSGDVYIEKEATINDELDKLRLSATKSLFERRDCVIIASVSCIYGLGSPEAYYGMLLMLEKGQKIARKESARTTGGDPVRTQRWRLPPRHLPRSR